MISPINPKKMLLSKAFNKLRIFRISAMCLSMKNMPYIRVVNYHSVPQKFAENFEIQLQYYSQHFVNVENNDLDSFFKNVNDANKKPGLIISFDDGFLDNYTVAAPLLREYGFTGYFFIPSNFPDNENQLAINEENEKFMNWNQLRMLKEQGHIIGCHTKNHHRMNQMDNKETLIDEIVNSKKMMDLQLEQNTDIFCWVGGEESTYTKSAMDMIKSVGYKYVFVTMAGAITVETDKNFLLRTNVEANWPLEIIKFQIWGLMDIFAKNKRKRVYRNIMAQKVKTRTTLFGGK